MPWFLPWSDSIKKRACRYLLQRYLGQFLEEKLTLDQLTVDLYNGTGSVSDVSLDVQALNELGEQQNLPLEFVDGYVSEMSVSIPWSTLLSESSYVEVSGMVLTVQPKQCSESGGSMLESMWSSMTSSIQMAAECLKQGNEGKETDQAQPLEGLELFAQTIDSVLSCVKVKFVNTVIRLEHLPKESYSGVGVELRIKIIDYCDEAGADMLVGEEEGQTHPSEKGFQLPTFTVKKFHCEGITLYTEEFPAEARTVSRSLFTEKSGESGDGALKGPGVDQILLGKLAGRQEIRLKLKQGEGVNGPKVDLEVNLGALTVFSSPRQLHLLLELIQGLATPDTQDTSNVAPRSRCTQKPMDPTDFERVEQELLHELHPVTMNVRENRGLQNAHGWSSASLDESDDEFLSIRRGQSGLHESIMSETTSLDASLSSSTLSTSTNPSKTQGPSYDLYNSPSRSSNSSRNKWKPGSGVGSEGVDVSCWSVRVNSIAVLVLHEDILTASPRLAPASIAQMQQLADSFFQQVGLFAISGCGGNRHFHDSRQVFLNACQLNHMRLLCAPVILEGGEKALNSGCLLSGVVNIASLELLECLIENKTSASSSPTVEYVEMLHFLRGGEAIPGSGEVLPVSPLSTQPDLRIHFSRTKKSKKARRYSIPHTEIKLHLQHCCSEIDISVVDRIAAVLNPKPLCTPHANRPRGVMTQQSCFTQAVENGALPDSRLDLQIVSPLLVVKLRFPVADLRPVHDMDRPPWWRQNVHKDVLYAQFSECSLHTSTDTRTPTRTYDLQARQIDLSFQEGGTDTAVPFAKAVADDRNGNSLPNGGSGFGWPRIVVRLNPTLYMEVLEEEEKGRDESVTQSMVMESKASEPSPFSSKRVVHESDTPHSTDCEGEELIVPGDREEMAEFIEHASRNAKLQLDITLPCISVHFSSKYLYELVYNRLNTDLLMWQAAAPKPTFQHRDHEYSTIADVDLASTLLRDSGCPAFIMCKSGIKYESDTDSEDGDGPYYTAPSHRFKMSHVTQSDSLAQSRMTATISITQGLLDIHTNVRDSGGNVVPGQQGELMFSLNEANIFTVSGYKGRSHHTYLCLQVNCTSMHHNALVRLASCWSPLDNVGCHPPNHLLPTIYRSERGAIVTSGADPVGTGSQHSKDMLTVALRSYVNDNRLKTVRVACGLRGVTLQHRMAPSGHSWFAQLSDFFDVRDNPVPGYQSTQTVTELHLHLWHSAVDYRPLHLPLRSMLTLGNLSISSNMAARTSSSTLRFIAEDASLFLSDKVGKSNGLGVELQLDYVCIVDLGLFELSLRLASNPRVDLRASNNLLNVHTCSDSARALAQLITYFAADSDLARRDVPPSPASKTSVKMEKENLIDTDNKNQNDAINLSESTVERVYDLMEEAMKDVNGSLVYKHKSVGRQSSGCDRGGVEVFFFPDESIASGVGAVNADISPPIDWADSDTSDDFCFLEHEAGSGIMPRGGLPEVRTLTTSPIRVVDNHFYQPTSKADVLRAPRHYPAPVLRYTLREMTVVWRIYGGLDFTTMPGKKRVTIADNASTPSSPLYRRTHLEVDGFNEVGFSKRNPKNVHLGYRHTSLESLNFDPSEKKGSLEPTSWLARGGPGRQHDVLMELQLNKVRFQHEVYPEGCVQASRQVLLVNELEVRDRLASSHINKFLYQYSSGARPKQSHANMVVIKAVHVRPDPKLSAQECCLKVSLLPLRLNIDQDSLLFLITFANQVSGITKQEGEGELLLAGNEHTPPVMSVGEGDKVAPPVPPPPATHLILLDEDIKSKHTNELQDSQTTNTPHHFPLYIRSFVFSPEVPIRLDYEGKHVDMTHGPLAGLLMGLGQLSCSELRLKRLTHRHGLLGFDKLLSYVVAEWIQDIKKNQLPNLLGGVGPMHSIVQLFQGIRDLFWLPIEQYQKDGRIVRGLQRGANSFTTSTAMAALELTARIVQAIQSVAETAFDMVSPGPSVRRLRGGKKGQHSRRGRYAPPADIREGVANAYALVKEGLGETAETLVRVASLEAEQKGAVGAVGGVLRQIPPTVVAPIILASAATSNLLGGVRSQLAPDACREANLKWRAEPT